MGDERFKALMAKRPCIGCIYFAQCGSTTRTEPCEGRMTKSEKANKENENAYMREGS